MSFKKGQSLSFDAIIASVIFLITMFAFLNFLFYFQNTSDYNKDIMEKEAVRVSTLLFSENETYGIMNNSLTNTLIIEDDEMDKRVNNVNSTTPYSVCVFVGQVDNQKVHPSDCDPIFSQSVRLSRIVKENDGTIVPLSILLFRTS